MTRGVRWCQPHRTVGGPGRMSGPSRRLTRWAPCVGRAVVRRVGGSGEGTGLGVPGQQLFRFHAVGEGTTTIGLQYVRPWETDVPPATTSDFTVNVT
jgi:hypothetical protein